MKKKITTLAAAALATFAMSAVYAQQGKSIDALKINQIQVLGTHNSYARPVDPKLLALADPIVEKMMGQLTKNISKEQAAAFKEYHPNGMKLSEGLNYNHPSFDVQLDAGIRSLEIDIYYDPTGNRFNHPASYRALAEKGISNLLPFDSTDLDKPGFKVLHMADFDFRTHYTTLKSALLALKDWSDKHPDHLPISIMVEAKDKGMPMFPQSAEVLPFPAAAFDELDEEVASIIGRDKLITPDDVRGSYTTLKEAVTAQNWPTVKAARGKFIFLLLPSTAGMDMNTPYVQNRPNLEKRMMFVQSTAKDSFAAFFLLDNAIVRQQDIRQYVKEGYMVRTRSDIETYEAKINDYSRAKAAFESGAQIISTDFFRPGNAYGTSYFVRLPGGGEVRANPVNAAR